MMPAHLSSQLANHLWQSTAVVAVAWILAFALRNNHARTRYWIWLVASLKFLLPFSLLVALGGFLQSSVEVEIAQPQLSSVVRQVAQPFPSIQVVDTVAAEAPAHRFDFLPMALLILWALGALVVGLSWGRGWRQTRRGVRNATPLEIPAEIPVLAASSLHEPGVFGIVRPALLLPEGIVDRLTAAQLDAIIAHEMCHVRRRDNLTFALHMLVQTLFWFHPLVWLVKARLLEERERACDEAVIQAGNEAQVYAEGILNVCKLYVEGPVACVSGVSGGELKKRIVGIMTRRVALRLDLGRKALLWAAGSLAVALPVVFGLVHVAQTHAAQSQASDVPPGMPKFEVATIKPVKGDNVMLGGMRAPDGSLRGKGQGGLVGIMLTPDGINMTGVPVQMLLRQAFGVEDDRIIGAPGWVKSDRWDMQAKVAPEDVDAFRKVPRDDRFAMLLPLLEDRFHLKYHHEMRELPLYELVVAKGGPKLTKSADNGPPEPPDNKAGAPPMAPGGPGGGPPRRRMMMMRPGGLESEGVPLELLAHQLAFILGHTVQDKTGLTGNYDFKLHFTPEDASPMGAGAADNGQPAEDAPPLFTALQEQLGLKLESTKAKVDVIVIDHIDLPTPD